jgi:hypothetical protein
MSAKSDERMVTIAVFDSVMEASLARGALEGAGLRALVPEELSARLRGTYFFPAGRLQVLESDRERALIELRRCQIRIVEPE